MFVAGALALSGVRALVEIPYYLTVSRGSVLIGGALILGLASPIGVGIFLGRKSAFFWAQVYLWLKFVGGFIVLPVYWCFIHAQIGCLALRSLPELLVTAALLGLIFWTTSEKFRYEPDA